MIDTIYNGVKSMEYFFVPVAQMPNISPQDYQDEHPASNPSSFEYCLHIYYEPLAEGVRHFKETEKGRDIMCESFSRLANKVGDEREEKTKVNMVKELMKNTKFTLEQALTALGIKGKERAIIAKQLQP